jgi:hypothetical protein
LNRIRFFFALVCLSLTTACGPFVDFSPTNTPEQPTAITSPSSPSCKGLIVAYIKNNTVYLWRENGTLQQWSPAGEVTSVRISRDCQWVAYVKNNELYRSHVDMLDPTLLVSKDYLASLTRTSSGEVRIVQIEFTPNSQNIFFTASISGDNGGLDLFKINFQTDLPERYVEPGLGGKFYPSPDSKCLVISRMNQMDLMCDRMRQPRNVITQTNECGFGAHAGPDVEWNSTSTGFSTVAPNCDGNFLHGSGRLLYVPQVEGNAIETVVDFIGWKYDKADISPDGNCVAHLVANGDLMDLRLACKDHTDSTFISYPIDKIDFLSWNPDSTHFIFWMNDNNSPTHSAINPLYSDISNHPIPIFSQQDMDSMALVAMPTKMRWISNDRFIFISNGLRIGTIQGRLVSIENDPSSYILDYDFSPKP